MNKGFVFLLILSFSSCNILPAFFLKERKNESKKEIHSFLDKHNYYYDYSFLLIDSLAYNLSDSLNAINTYKLARGGNASVVQLRVYNNEGKLVNGYEQCFGNFRLLNIIKQYPYVTIDYLPINYNLHLSNTLKLIDIPSSLEKEVISKIKNSEYTYIAFYTIWANYYSKVVLKELTKFKAKHKDKDICIILVNTAL